MKKKVLVLKMSAYNGLRSSVMRTIAMIKGLLALDYDVDWLTIRPPETQVLSDVGQYTFLDNVRIIYADENKVYNNLVKGNGGLKRILVSTLRKIYHTFAMFDFTETIAKNVSIETLPSREYDYIISVSDPKTTHIAAERLISQGLKAGKWIQYWGDPFACDITKKNIYPRFWLKRIEKKLFSSCDKIVYTSPFTLREQQRMYPAYADKMIMTPTAYITPKVYKHSSDEKYTVGYFGAYPSNIRNILPFYNACVGLGDEIRAFIQGNSDIQLAETENVSVMPRGDAREYEAQTDLFVCVLNSKGTQIPGKIYHYAAVNRPILVIMDGDAREEMTEYLESFNRYIICDNDEKSITEAIMKIKSENLTYEPSEKLSSEYVAGVIIE